MLSSDIVRPFRGAESPVRFGCAVNELVALGSEGAVGIMIISRLVKMHLSEEILDDTQNVDQYRIILVSRLLASWYSRSRDGLFEVPKPLTTMGIGVDQIPDFVKQSSVFSGNDLGLLGNVESLPTTDEINIFVSENFAVKAVLSA